MVNLFGKLEIYTSKGVLTEAEISSPMICRFLVYMLLHGKHPVPARTIHEHIWPEEDIENAGKKIKSLAYRLQNVFAVISDYRLIISTPMGYQINPELDIVTDIQHLYFIKSRHIFRDLITCFSRRSDGRSRGNRKSDLPHGGRDDHTGHWG